MKYVTREGSLSATVDVETALTTLYDDTAPGPLVVPSGVSKIKQMIVGIGDGAPATADANTNYLLRMTGDGLADGEQTFTIANSYAILATAGETAPGNIPAMRFDVDIDVVSGGRIALFGTQAGGVTVGTPEMVVCLGFA